MEFDEFGRTHRRDSNKPTVRWGPRHESAVVNDSCRVFIGNLTWGTTTQDLQEHMQAAGFNTKFVNIFQDHGRSKGCGLVHFQSIQEAKNAIQTFNSTMWKGRLIIMRFDGEAGGIKVGNNVGNNVDNNVGNNLGNNVEKTTTKPPTQLPVINVDLLTSELNKLKVKSPDVIVGVYTEITLIEGLSRNSAKSIRRACYISQSTSWTEINDGTEMKRCIIEETNPDDGSITITTTTTTYKETDALPRGTQVAEETTTEARIVPAPSVSSSRLQSSSNSCTRPWLQMLEKSGLHDRLVADNFNSSIRHCKVKFRKQDEKNYSIVFEYSAGGQQIPLYQMSKLKAVFHKHTCAGFLDWLSGATGWKYDVTDGTKWKTCVVAKLNSLQGIHSIFAKDRTQKYFFGKSGRMTWRRQRIAPLGPTTSFIGRTIILSRSRVCKFIALSSSMFLMICADNNSNRYPLTFVTEVSMNELIEGIIQLFRSVFRPSSDPRPLGTRWSECKKKFNASDFNLQHCPEWTEAYLEQRLNGVTHLEALKANVKPTAAN